MKKILWFGLTILLILGLISCQKEEEASINVVLNEMDVIFAEGDSLSHVTTHVTFPLTSQKNKKAVITWNSDQPHIIDAYGTLNQPRDNTTVTLSVTVSLNGLELTKYFNLLVVGYYQEITITFKVQNATFKTIKMNKGDTVDAFDNPNIEGYTFDGWFYAPQLTTMYQFSDTLNESTTIEAKMTPIPVGEYIIEIYHQNLDDDLYTLISTEFKQGYVGDTVEVSKTYTGFSLDSELSHISGTLSSTPLTLKLYFLRDVYKITYFSEGIEIGYEYIRYGQNPAFDEPTKLGYTFGGWSLDEEGEEIIGFEDFLTTPLTLYAVWLEEGSYTGYYQTMSGVTDQDLLLALRTLLNTNFKPIKYGDARYILDDTDKDPNNPNNVILIYSAYSVSGVWDGGITWNREHVWPQSLLGIETNNESLHVGADLHNLKPANPGFNSSRGNKFFDIVTNPYSYAPRPEVRGDVARILFYMVTKYEYLSLVDLPANTDPVRYQMAQLSRLYAWHFEDPVDNFERNRNNIIYSFQQNRNPYIDHPEFVERIWGSVVTLSTSTQTITLVTINYDIDYSAFKKSTQRA